MTERRWHYRVGFGLIVLLLLATAILLPVTVVSVVSNFRGSYLKQTYVVSTTPHSAAAPTHTDLFIQVVGLDEVRGRVTLLLTGYHVCDSACNWSDRIYLFSLWDVTELEGLPPSASITLAPSAFATTATVDLPIRGQPMRYPFDSYELQLGVAMERLFPDGAVQPLPANEARSQLFVALQPRLPQHSMPAPVALDTLQTGSHGAPLEYVYATRVTVVRLLHVRVLAVQLVVLIAAAAVYAVVLRPFQELVINVGGLILGIWGIRSVLTPGSVSYITGVDLSLSVVILFLLGAITVRALLFMRERGAFPAFRKGRK